MSSAAAESVTVILLWTFIVICFDGTAPEVASSVSAMTSMITQEDKLIQHLRKVLDLSANKKENATCIRRLKRYLECIERRHQYIVTMPRSLAHPIIGFRLMRRLVKDWGDVTSFDSSRKELDNAQILYDNLEGIRDVISKWSRWPKPLDITDAVMGLIRIGQTYKLYPRTSVDHGGSNPTSIINGLDLFETHSDNSNSGDGGSGSCSRSNSDGGGSRSSGSSNNCDSNSSTSKSNECYRCNYSCITANGNNNDDNNHSMKDTISSNKLKDTNKTDSQKSCHYDHTVLNVDDFIYITNIAINKKLKHEASRWHNLVKASIYCNNRRNQTILKDKLEKLRRKIEAITEPKAKTDKVMENYIQLCHKSIQPWDYSINPPQTLLCTWRHVYPYLRYKVEILHSSPDIYQFHDVISLQEMDHIKQQASLKLSPSSLDLHGDADDQTRYWRVSQTAWFPDETPVLQSLSRRVGQLTGLATGLISVKSDQMDSDYSEPLQVVNYGLGGLYGPHLDTLHTSSQKSSDSKQYVGDRLATWMFYLGDVQVGGATVFPLIGIDVTPIKGSAILWYNLHRNGQTDKNTVHAGCPVVIGDKWVANKWVRETAQWRTRPCLLDDSA